MNELLPGKYRRTIRNIWKFAIGGISLLVLFILAVRFNFFWLFGPMPDLITLENPTSELASELISEDNQSLGKYFFENRAPVEHDQVSPKLIEALIATEDARFIKHSGIDARSLIRVVKGLLRDKPAPEEAVPSPSRLPKTFLKPVQKNIRESSEKSR